jgi:hypothetical protein
MVGFMSQVFYPHPNPHTGKSYKTHWQEAQRVPESEVQNVLFQNPNYYFMLTFLLLIL